MTGLGIVSPVGIGVASAWENILAGRSGITRITRFDASPFASHIAGEVKGFDVSKYLPVKEARRFDTFVHYGTAAAIEAIGDAGVTVTEHNAERIGVNIGSGIGGLPMIEETLKTLQESGPRRISPFFIPGTIINMVAGNLSIMYGFKGPNLAITTACTTSTHCIGESARLIAYGDADVMIAGGSEATVCPLAIGGFSAARALSTRNDEPELASRPWDKGRDGFVLGEGAGMVVLEELEHAKRRGAKIYAEVAGYGATGDAFHLTAPPPDHEGLQRAMRRAIRDAGATTNDVQYINAHGTSTPHNDLNESRAIRAVFGDEPPAVSSTKSMTGHMLGAAGAVEMIVCALVVRDKMIPPTINYETPDPECDLDFTPNVAVKRDVNFAISNSSGFGGHNVTLAVKRFEG